MFFKEPSNGNVNGLPNSSTSTRECAVACVSILAVSLNSTKNVLSPLKKKIKVGDH